MNADRIVSISAIVVAIGTLFIIVYQTHLTREAQQASVLPYLQMGFSRSENSANINLVNRGVGPALIDDIRVVYRGQQHPGDPYAYYSQLNKDSHKGLYIDRVLPGMLIPAGTTITMIGVRQSPEARLNLVNTFSVNGNDAQNSDKRKAIIEVAYSSIYGKQWVIRSNEIVPEPR